MTSARDFRKLRREPGGDVHQYRAAWQERAHRAFAAWRASGYQDGAAYARGMEAREAGQKSLAAR